MKIFDASLDTMQKAMDVRMRNQRVIAANLANVDTPGFKARRLDFEGSMANALRGRLDPAVIERSDAPGQTLDGNNVDLEGELSQLGRNKLMYEVTAQLMAMKFRQLHQVLDSERY